MKKFRFFLGALAVLGIVSFMTSCNPNSLVTLDVPEDFTAAPGDAVWLVYTLTPDAVNNGELGSFRVEDDGEFEYTETYSGSSSVTDSVEYTVPADAEVGSTIIISFTATDGKSGQPNTKTTEITVESGITLLTYNPTLTAQATGSSSMGRESFFSLVDGNKYSWSNVDANADKADFVFMRHAFLKTSDDYALISPDNSDITTIMGYNSITYSTTGKNATKFEKKSGIDFAAVTAVEISEMTIGTPVYKVSDIKEGDIFLIETQAGTKALIKVGASTDGSSYGASTMTFDIKAASTGTSAK